MVKFYDGNSDSILGHLKPLITWKEALLNYQEEANKISGNDVIDEELLEEKNKEIDKLINEIFKYCENLIQHCSSDLFEIRRKYDEALEEFDQTETNLKLQAREKFDQLIIDQFREWRLDEINQLRRRIQNKVIKIKIKLD